MNLRGSLESWVRYTCLLMKGFERGLLMILFNERFLSIIILVLVE